MRGLGRATVTAAFAVWTVGVGVPIAARYRALHIPNGLDQGYFLQRTWQAASLDEPVRTLLNTEQGHGLIVTRHFEPILVLISPWVGLWPDHRVLLLAQLLALGLTLPFVWGLARRLLSGPQAVLATVAWLGMPVLWQMEVMGFRTMALATPFVAGCLWAASSGRVAATLALGTLALACREEVVWALLAALPWLWVWRGRVWRDTTWALAGLCGAWLGLLAAAHGGPSTFWALADLPRELLARLSAPDGATHTSLAGAAWFLGQWLGPASAAALLAPLAALPLGLWWLGIQASSGLAGTEAVHLFGPMAGLMALLLPLACRRLPARWVTPVLGALVLAGGVQVCHRLLPEWQAWRDHTPSPGGDIWWLLTHVPDDAPLLTEARFLPAVAARARVYATEDWPEPDRLDGRYGLALLRDGHPWESHLAATGFREARVCPGVTLWSGTNSPSAGNEPLTPH